MPTPSTALRYHRSHRTTQVKSLVNNVLRFNLHDIKFLYNFKKEKKNIFHHFPLIKITESTFGISRTKSKSSKSKTKPPNPPLSVHSAELVAAFIFWITVVNSFLGNSKNFAPNSQALQHPARYS